MGLRVDNWDEIKIGDEVSVYVPPDGPCLVVKVESISDETFTATPSGFPDKHIEYPKDAEWYKYHR
jgi:hypothetical protein